MANTGECIILVMFGTLGGPELVLILVLALIVFGPRKLPEIGKSMGKMLAEFRKASHEFQRTIEDEVEAEKARPPLSSPPPPAAAEAPDARPPSEATVSRDPAPDPIEPK
jgi:TatA/E family protein of Tat protein translocase